MISTSVVLKKKPKIEFQLHDNGFRLIDEQMEGNPGLYSYTDLQSIELRRAWFPRFAKWLRIITWIFNGVPYFPDAESYKKSSIVLNIGKAKLGIWLTDTYMANQARRLKNLLDNKCRLENEI